MVPMPSDPRATPTNHRRLALLVIGILLATLAPTATASAADEPIAAADEVLVRYRAGITADERSRVASEHGLTVARTSPDGRTQVVFAEGRSPATARRELGDDPRVLAVADNHLRERSDEITAEPFLYPEQWGMHNVGQTITGGTTQTGVADVDIDGLEALRVEKGDSDVVVAVIDDGVDFSHPDLATQMWVNPGEAGAKANNGIDDDGNKYIDDVHGWDFCNNDNTLYDGEDGEGHGTHVAGTIAGALNGSGVVGVAPGVKIMALKFISESASCAFSNDDEAVLAIDYAASFNVPIINASWGGSGESAVLDFTIGESGALFVAAAGNAGSNMDGGGQKHYPAASTQPNVLTVAAIDQRGNVAAFSNYGKVSVDLSAPGTNILSSYPGGYAWANGTSMAAPHVSGVAALVASVLTTTPTPAVLRKRLLDSGVPLAPTAGKTVTGKLVNANLAIDVTAPTAHAISGYRFDAGTVLGSNTVSSTMVWPAATDALSGVRDYQIQLSANAGPFATFVTTVGRSATRSLAIGTPYRFRLRARDRASNYSSAKDGPIVTAFQWQDTKSSAVAYSGKWSIVSTSGASGGALHRTGSAGASVTFTTTARAIAIVGRRATTNGQAKIYVDGAYVKTVNLQRSTTQNKYIFFSTSWASTATHSVKVVVVGTAGHPGVDIDAFVALR
jgi:subtilisin family serine protease